MVVTLTQAISTKKLIAAGNNEVWCEMTAGTMTELTDANGDIDTTDQLCMFEAYQKVFVVNGANLKVADFVNTKIDLGSGNELTSPPAHGDIITQLTSNAKMVVDFVDSTMRYIYGYTFAETFVTTAGYTLTSDNATATMDPATAPKPDVVSEATTTPHWYDWTVYPDIVLSTAKYGQAVGATKTFGSLPNKAYLGCLYRGRACLSGDPEHPHQWYQARQGNPWDFAYIANDAQSPVKGGDADAGEIGDIVAAIIPYKDDYQIHGCASSMWYLSGDAADGGSINELILTVGIFGAYSYCFDDEGNFYFWGTNGIYMSNIPATPKNISDIRLPNLVNDEAADPSTYRITMAYDRKRHGILICITKLSDGSNSNYFLDLRTNGFYPESYGDVRGVYSLFDYAANSNTYRDLLVGCKDGHIRKFNPSLKSDNTTADAAGAGTVAIDSYVSFGPLPLSDLPDKSGKIESLSFETAGGGSGGTQSDSDDVEFKVFSAKTAEKVIEKISANTNPNFAGTIKGPASRRGRGKRHRQKVRGSHIGIRLHNDTAAETWAFENLTIGAKQSGRVK